MSNARSNLDQASSDSVPTTTVSRMRQSMSRKKKAPSRIKKKQGTEAEKKEHLASSGKKISLSPRAIFYIWLSMCIYKVCCFCIAISKGIFSP